MTPAQRREARFDVERLRKAAERVDQMERDLADVESRLKAAKAALERIHTWASLPHDGQAKKIAGHCADMLRLL